MPRLMLDKQGDGLEKARDEIVVFLGEYGSYLRMDTCLAYAAVLKADTVVDLLLSIAKHDPRHREMIKQTTKSTSMVFYEPVSFNMSAFIVRRSRLRSLNRLFSLSSISQCCPQYCNCYKESRRKPRTSENKRSLIFVPPLTQMCGLGK